jgi:2-methylcitrate dehydratase PrpD
MTISESFAHYIARLKFADLPSEAVSQATKCVLDGLGNIIAGSMSSKVLKLDRSSLFSKTRGESHIIANASGTVSPAEAAVKNAISMRSLDLDDGHRSAMGHPGSVVVPVALAVGEATHMSGKELIVGIIAAYEIYARTGAVINPKAYNELGFESTGICGSIASAVMISKAYKMNAVDICNAIGIAASFAGGLIEYQNDGTDGKYICPAITSLSGFHAAELASVGFTGPANIFEGRQGFFHAHGSECDPEKVSEGLGKDFGILDTYFKIHSCMRGLHASIDGILALRNRYDLESANVQKILVKTTPLVKRLDKKHPMTLQQAQANVSFVLATALKFGNVSIQSLKAALNDEEIPRIEEKIIVAIDDEIYEYWKKSPTNWGASKIEAELSSGECVTEWTPIAFGEYERPLSLTDLTEKFFRLSESTAFYAKKDEIVDKILNIKSCPDITAFMASLCR